MDLLKEKQKLEAQIKQIEVQFHQTQGALAMIDILIKQQEDGGSTKTTVQSSGK